MERSKDQLAPDRALEVFYAWLLASVGRISSFVLHSAVVLKIQTNEAERYEREDSLLKEESRLLREAPPFLVYSILIFTFLLNIKELFPLTTI